MKKFILPFLMILALSACADFVIERPLAVKTSRGKILLGSIVASKQEGFFSASDGEGLQCAGTYDQYSQNIMLTVNFKCSDGRTGHALIQRDSSLINGQGQGKLSDGTKFKLLFGDYTTQL